MDIKEVREKKSKLEEDIANLLLNFYNDTGLRTKRIDIEGHIFVNYELHKDDNYYKTKVLLEDL